MTPQEKIQTQEALEQHYVLERAFQDEGLTTTFEEETEYLYELARKNSHGKYSRVTVLDLCCGNGRTIGQLKERHAKEAAKRGLLHKLTKKPFTLLMLGMDKNPLFIEEATPKLSSKPSDKDYRASAFFKEGDVLDKGQISAGTSDLTYMTMNTLGCELYDQRQQVVNNMARFTRTGGFVTSFTWNRDHATTEFLKRRYDAIGFDIQAITPEATVIKSRFTGQEITSHRLDPIEVAKLYHNAGLKNGTLVRIEPYWLAMTGVKK